MKPHKTKEPLLTETVTERTGREHKHVVLDPYVNRPRRLSVYIPPELGRTDQSFRDECNINIIVKNFIRTGALPPHLIQKKAAMFADVSEVGDLQDALQRVTQAREGFATLPAAIRDRFSNDPVQLLAFLEDPANRQEAIDLDIIEG